MEQNRRSPTVSESEHHKPPALRSIAFMLASFPIRLLQFISLVVLITFGIGTIIVWLGIPVLMLTTWLTHRFGDLERRWIHTMLGIAIPNIERRPATGNILRRWQARLTDPTTWRDLGYLLLAFPIGIIEFVLGVTGIILLPIGIWVVPAVAWLHGQWAVTLLGLPRAARAEAEASRLQASRARGIDAVEAERRRIERDLHDGAQQRLVSVAMSLGQAKAKVSNSSLESAELHALIDEAHNNAKLAVSELRDLARGIYPAVLADRGLDAALSAQAAKSPIPVDVVVDVDPRPPAAVETTAYFIASESLTNIAKHSRADQASVAVRRHNDMDDMVVVEITDNGAGGAELRPGGGLVGLADRAATIDGTISVVSPPGGPTVIRADLPCTW